MKIIIMGAGKVGKSIIRHLSKEDHEIVVIDDSNEVIEDVIAKYDVMGICGSAVNYDIQKEAGVATSDVLIAATRSDEVNMLCCLIGKKLGCKNTIARVREYSNSKQSKMLMDTLNITMMINPELEVAREIERILKFPEAIKVETFGSGKLNLSEFLIPENSPLVGLKLYELSQKYNLKTLVCAVKRNDEIIIPDGNFTLEAHDYIHITSDKASSRSFISKLGLAKQRMHNVLIVGGGMIAMYLSDNLRKSGFDVKIIEQDKDKCVELSESLQGVSIINGDGSDQLLLKEEGLDQSDAVISLTGIDEENIIISMYASKRNVPKVITKINKFSFAELMNTIEMASVITPQDVAANEIVSFIRANSNMLGNNVKRLYKLLDDQIEAIEFIATNQSKVLNTPLKDLHIKKNVLISGIIREGQVVIPTGTTSITEGDSVIIITKTLLNDLDEILV